MILATAPKRLVDLDDDHIVILEAVWRSFDVNEEWPAFRHVADVARRKRVDARSLVDDLMPHFVTSSTPGMPVDSDRLSLTIRGLAMCGVVEGIEIAEVGAKLMGHLADMEVEYIAPADTGDPLTVAVEDVRLAIDADPVQMRLLWHVLDWDARASRQSGVAEGWTIRVKDAIRPYTGVKDLQSFLRVEAREIAAAPGEDVYIAPIHHARTTNASYVSGSSLTLEVDPSLTEATERLARGQFDGAVRDAMHTVEVLVREASGAADSVFGIDLVTEAFKKGGALRDPNMYPAEAEALMQLFRGAFGAHRNPAAHRRVGYSEGEAREVLVLASLLLRVVDRATRDRSTVE